MNKPLAISKTRIVETAIDHKGQSPLPKGRGLRNQA
jgi:hypothetical protein